ncbi:MAG: anti-sigma factor family protein, partial [Ktedonobacterales bacterium]
MSGTHDPWHDDAPEQRERLSTYLDGELAPAERAELAAHLATCDACQAELASLRAVRALLRGLPEPVSPRSFALPIARPAVVAVTPAARPRANAARARQPARRVGSMRRAAPGRVSVGGAGGRV